MHRPHFWLTSFLAAIAAMAFTSQLIAKDDSSVSGTFKGNGKDAKLAYVSARKGEPFGDKPTTILVLTEKDHSKDKKPDVKAGFGDFGSSLVITINDEGKIIGCVIAHSAHKKSGFNSLGNMTMSDLKRDNGKIQGRISSNGKQEFFGDTWEVSITFNTKAP